MKQLLVIGSRGSKLALAQANLIESQLRELFPSLEIRIDIIKTTGDVKSDPLSVIGGKGVFVKELEDALIDGRVDLAVHSLKDVPTIIPEQLTLAAICRRDDPRDALVLPLKKKSASVGLKSLRQGSTVGTSSLRRLSQLKHLRPDLEFKDIRGNVDTRLRKLDEGEYDALVLACAGLRRLQLEGRISSILTAGEMLPAVGQGALAIETRAEDQDVNEIAEHLDHKFTRLACLAERSLLRSLGGGCQLPIAAYAVVRDKRIRLDGLVADPEGKQLVRDRISGALDESEDLGKRLAEQLLANGARELLDSEAN
jgi:hydroxymethylbilane synthase